MTVPDEPLARVRRALDERQPHRMVPDLSRIRDLVDLLGQPQRSYPAIHVTGTNGKTSTSRMVDALLRAFGLRTGRFTSPHLASVTERIAVDGQPLDPDRFAAAYDDVAPYVELVDAAHLARGGEQVTFHELLTAMAFAAFADIPVDVAVVEVGMGGSWDATNVLAAPVAVIGRVDLDHTGVLGSTTAAIAGEKAGIVHDGATVVVEAQDPDADVVIAARAARTGAHLVRAGTDVGLVSRRLAVGGQVVDIRGAGGTYDEVFLPLYGEHQARNAVLALAAVEAFLGGGRTRLDVDAVRDGFAQADSPGRLEVVRTSPTVLVDAAHNPAGARTLAAAIAESFAFARLVGVVAVLDDKDAEGILAALAPVLDEVVVTRSSSSRAMPTDVLAEVAEQVLGVHRVSRAPRLPEALDLAVALAERDGAHASAGVLVTGSVVTAGEARTLAGR